MAKDTITAWRFFERNGEGDGLKSRNGVLVWPMPNGKPGKWITHAGPVVLCQSGLHASPTVLEALFERQGYILGKVEARKIAVKKPEKFVARQMRLVRVYEREYVVGLGIVGASLALKHFENQYPNDDRPREAIRAAIEWAKSGTPAADAAAAAADRAADAAADAAAAAAADRAAAAAAAADRAAYRAADAAYRAAAAAATYQAAAADADADADAAAATYREQFNALALEMLALPKEQLGDWLETLLAKS
jgi:hypothetical protein